MIFSLFGFCLLVTIDRTDLEIKNILFGLLVSFLYSALDEFHQYFTLGRFCVFEDLLVNGFGILFSLVVYLLLAKK